MKVVLSQGWPNDTKTQRFFIIVKGGDDLEMGELSLTPKCEIKNDILFSDEQTDLSCIFVLQWCSLFDWNWWRVIKKVLNDRLKTSTGM